MDTTVRETGERAVAAFEMAGFTRLTVLEYAKWIRRLDLLARKQGVVCTAGKGAKFASLTTIPLTGKFSGQPRKAHSRLAGLFDSCVLTGRVNPSLKKRGEQEFAALPATCSEEIEERGFVSEASTAYCRTAWIYLLYLEASGITSLYAGRGHRCARIPGSTRGLDPLKFTVYGVRMNLGDVLGSVTAPEQVPSLRSHRLLVVQRVGLSGAADATGCEVAVDLVGAGPGDRVLLAAGSAARLAPETRTVATDLTIVAIVDSVDITEGVMPRVSMTTRSVIQNNA